MTTLVLAPHNDDETLFAAAACIRHNPTVVVCLKSKVQERYGITAATREAETEAALEVLGVDRWIQLEHLDTEPDWDALEHDLRRLTSWVNDDDAVFAPAAEPGGHDHHNQIAALAGEVFGAGRVTHYLTYTVDGKSAGGTLVAFEPGWVTLKLRALACYRSQIETAAAGCTEHFLRDHHEYLAA